MIITLTKKELKARAGADFKSGDIILVGKYEIHIEYGQYPRPSLKSWVFDTSTSKTVKCWPAGCKGCWPYFIADFLSREASKPCKK